MSKDIFVFLNLIRDENRTKQLYKVYLMIKSGRCIMGSLHLSLINMVVIAEMIKLSANM
jgi:hypothetical protein